jgi:hypothetical protein
LTLTPLQLSSIFGGSNATTAEQRFGAVLTEMFFGQEISGGWLSLTVMVKEQWAALPAASTVLQVTVVVPFGKRLPEPGLHTTLNFPPQLSVAAGVS